MNIKYELNEIHPKVFLVTIDNAYDLAMTFCRVQEFYESPFKEIRGKHFNILEFQRMYSMEFGDGIFTYPHDWAGFNVPSKILIECYSDINKPIIDFNCYDEIIWDINNQIRLKGIEKYYLIGSEPNAQGTINHEVAHAFYYLHPKYKSAANKIADKVSEKSKNKIKNWLSSLGYCDNVFKDELQAYLTADINRIIECCNASKTEEKKLEKISKELQNLNNDYKNRKV